MDVPETLANRAIPARERSAVRTSTPGATTSGKTREVHAEGPRLLEESTASEESTAPAA